MREITSVDELVELVGEPVRRVAEKVRPALHDLDRQWLAASPFCPASCREGRLTLVQCR